MVRQITGTVYRVSMAYDNAIFVECDSRNLDELISFCARKMAQEGCVITSVTSLSPSSKQTPRLRFLSTPEFKKLYQAEVDRIKRGELVVGDYVRTPRFLTVRIDEVFSSEKELRKAGYSEPTHYDSNTFFVLGKSVGLNQMVFAAARKE